MITVLKAGLCDTIQDSGRLGFGAVGLGQSGPLDWFSAALANACVGNPAEAALLEMHFPAPHLLFETPALVALSGMAPRALLNGQHRSKNRLISIAAGSEISFEQSLDQVCHYLAVRGGIAVKPLLSSASTHLRASLPGLAGRRLERDDKLPIGVHINRRPQASFSINTHQVMPYERNVIQALAGPDLHLLSPELQQTLLRSTFTTTGSRDRMGMRLQPSVPVINQLGNLPSAPVEPGTIQLLPNGELALLLADAQTVGGYARVLQVAKASLPIVVQKPVGSLVQFELIGLEEALEALQKQLDYISQIRRTSALLFYGS